MNLDNPYNIALIGFSGSGKTYNAKRLYKLSNLPLYCYDINRDWNAPQPPTMDKFLEQAKNKKKHFIVFEEATIFFSHSGRSDDLTNLMVRKRYNENKSVFLFHSLRSLPLFIMDYLDAIILLKTGDRKTLIEKKFKDDENIIEAYREVNDSADPHANIFIPLGNFYTGLSKG